MEKLRRLGFLGMLLGIIQLTACALNPAAPLAYSVATTKPYDEVMAELEIAISEQNFRVTGHSRVGRVIRERGTANFPEYDTIQFCNLTLAKTLLLMSPHAIEHMPCNVVVYQYAGKTIVKTHLLPTDSDNPEMNAFMAKMNDMLKQIVDFAAEQ